MKGQAIFLALIVLLAGTALSQTQPKFSDDRELFIGVPGGGVMPNIMILADNSISMRTAIYHPAYNPNLFYNHTNPSDQTSDMVSLSNFSDYRSLSSTATFNICGDRGSFVLDYDYRARVTATNNRRMTITVISGTWTAANVVGKTVEWGCDNTPNSCTGSAVISSIQSTTPLVLNMDRRVTMANGTNIYINPHWELSSSIPNSVGFTPEGSTCESYGYTNTVYANAKLYGTLIDGSYQVQYDDNYLYWLAFHADATQVAQVTHWATTGAFLQDSSGQDIYAGYYRLQTTQKVLKDVIEELWTKNDAYNFGLACFGGGAFGHDGTEILNNMQNATNLSGSLNVFKNSIDSLSPTTYTPLAEALSDIWAYFKSGSGSSSWNWIPESATNDEGCGWMSGTSGKPPTACPIQYYCQHNYVIIMTDGQSTYDDFSNSKYSGALFRQPVSGWGDGDTHDPTTYNGTQPTFSDYCPQQTCWIPNYDGTDFLDDVADYIYKNDIFPDDIRPEMPGKQVIETFTIGFAIDNQLLKETAENGNGEYYTATDYAALKAALSSAITNIMMRNFAFASYTAPKKVTTAVGEGATFIGYFMPSSKEIWDGHLQSYTLYDRWFADLNGNDVLDPDEQSSSATPYTLKTTCQSVSGHLCFQVVEMADNPNWDATDKLSSLSTARQLWTLDFSGGSPVPLNFTLAANTETLHTLFQLSDADDPASADPLLDRPQTNTIVRTISSKLNFGDIFHSDIVYVGAPLRGKLFLHNYNPLTECVPSVDSSGNPNDPDCFDTFRYTHQNRRKVLFVGTNTGIIHMIDANTPNSGDASTADGGKEIWGFIPDEVLPTLKTIAIDKKFAYTTDGRMIAEDIYVHGATSNPWKTILVFGLKDGGSSFYALDVTEVEATPRFYWKFKDDTYSGKSWSKPIIGKIRYSDGTSAYDRWVVIVSGGMAFNNENVNDQKGKAVFVLDAASGDVIWMIGFDNDSGAVDVSSTTNLEVNTATYTNLSGVAGIMHRTKDPAFNFCIPSAISAVDKDNNGYIDSIYFGNVAGHVFKVDASDISPSNWKTYSVFRKDLATNLAAGTITGITINSGLPADTYTVSTTSGEFQLGQNVMGLTSKAMGFITEVDSQGSNDLLTIQETSAESLQIENIVVRPYDPVFISPAIHKDICQHYWVSFGTGDRLRSRTNATPGKFVSLMDTAATPSMLTTSNLVQLTFSSTTDNFTGSTDIKVDDKWGWYFNFPNAAEGEKLFDPDPIILPDANLNPHIFFNTYQYVDTGSSTEECNAPTSGAMRFYEITVDYCKGGNVTGYREEGRISGGGMMEGSEFIMIEGGGQVGSVDLPGLGTTPKLLPKPLPYTGGLLFLKEKKR